MRSLDVTKSKFIMSFGFRFWQFFTNQRISQEPIELQRREIAISIAHSKVYLCYILRVDLRSTGWRVKTQNLTFLRKTFFLYWINFTPSSYYDNFARVLFLSSRRVEWTTIWPWKLNLKFDIKARFMTLQEKVTLHISGSILLSWIHLRRLQCSSRPYPLIKR